MTPSQLRTFLAVASTGSVHGAAAELVVSQPAVSTAVATLQRELGVLLVNRSGRGVVLTDAGQVLSEYAQTILALLDEGRRAARAAADPERGTLRLAAVTTAGEQVLPGLLASFREQHPQVEIVLEVGNRQRVWELLQAHRADLAIGGRPPVGSDLQPVATAPNELVVVAAPSPPGRRRRGRVRPTMVGVEELAGRTWLVREPGSGTRAATEELFSELDLEPVRLTIGSNGAIREAAVAGLGIALMSRAAVRRHLDDATLEEWTAGPLPLERPWYLVRRRRGPLVAAASLFYDHLRGEVPGWSEL